MSLGTFDPTNAYDHVHNYAPDAEDAVFTVTDLDGSTLNTYDVKVQRQGYQQPSPQQSPYGLAPVDFTLWLWPAGSGCPQPKHGDTITLASSGDNLVVQSSNENRLGQYAVRANRQAT